jgi:hypothetical protein
MYMRERMTSEERYIPDEVAVEKCNTGCNTAPLPPAPPPAPGVVAGLPVPLPPPPGPGSSPPDELTELADDKEGVTSGEPAPPGDCMGDIRVGDVYPGGTPADVACGYGLSILETTNSVILAGVCSRITCNALVRYAHVPLEACCCCCACACCCCWASMGR